MAALSGVHIVWGPFLGLENTSKWPEKDGCGWQAKLAMVVLAMSVFLTAPTQPVWAEPDEATLPETGISGPPIAVEEPEVLTQPSVEEKQTHIEELRARVEEILATYRIGAEEGDPVSMYILAHGLLLTGQQNDGIRWMEKAAARREPRALAAMGQFHQYGDFGVPQDYQLAADLYAAAAEQGDLDGMFGLAFLYELGRGVEWNIGKAEELYARAAERGHDLSQFTLARIHLLGKVGAPDYITSYKWLKVLTEQAEIDAELKSRANVYLGRVKKVMQPGQIIEGEAAARAWLQRTKPPARKPDGLVIP